MSRVPNLLSCHRDRGSQGSPENACCLIAQPALQQHGSRTGAGGQKETSLSGGWPRAFHGCSSKWPCRPPSPAPLRSTPGASSALHLAGWQDRDSGVPRAFHLALPADPRLPTLTPGPCVRLVLYLQVAPPLVGGFRRGWSACVAHVLPKRSLWLARTLLSPPVVCV